MYCLIIKDDVYNLIIQYSDRLGIDTKEFLVSAIRSYIEMSDKFLEDKEDLFDFMQLDY